MERDIPPSVANELLENLRTQHDEAFLYVSQGLSYEEQGENALATEMYYKALDKLGKGLNLDCDHPGCKGPQWDKAREMQRKMKHIKGEVDFRLIALEAAGGAPLHTERPPTYEEATRAGTAQTPRRVAEELFNIASGVQIFFVSAAGSVEAPSKTTDLHVYRLPGKHDAVSPEGKSPLSWLQVGSWIYPLVPQQSPALKSGYGAYIFPNIDASQSESVGASVGVLLPSDLPYDEHKLFESLMEELTAMKIEVVPDPSCVCMEPAASRMKRSAFGQKVSDSLVLGSEALSKGLTRGAQATSEALRMGTARLKQYLQPEAEPVKVDPRVKQGLEILRTATGSLRNVSEYVATKVGDLTVTVAQLVAMNVSCDSCIAGLPSAATGGGSSKMQDAVVIAKGGLQGLANVYVGLENASKILANSLVNETVQVVGHKYGTDAAQVVDNAMNSVTNVTAATAAVRGLGLKRIATRTAKQTGKAILQEYVSSLEAHGNLRESAALRSNLELQKS